MHCRVLGQAQVHLFGLSWSTTTQTFHEAHHFYQMLPLTTPLSRHIYVARRSSIDRALALSMIKMSKPDPTHTTSKLDGQNFGFLGELDGEILARRHALQCSLAKPWRKLVADP